MASLTICQSTSSGTSGVAKGFTTRKQTSVNGSLRNSSNSSGECRAISAGMYRPPSGAKPRSTAPRNEVSGAWRDVLRYLMKSDQRPEIGDQRHTAATKTSIFSASVLISGLGSLFSFHLLSHTFQELLCIEKGPQFSNAHRAMRECFVTPPTRFNQGRKTP